MICTTLSFHFWQISGFHLSAYRLEKPYKIIINNYISMQQYGLSLCDRSFCHISSLHKSLRGYLAVLLVLNRTRSNQKFVQVLLCIRAPLLSLKNKHFWLIRIEFKNLLWLVFASWWFLISYEKKEKKIT